MFRSTLTAMALALVAAAPLDAGDAKAKKPLGTWTRTVSDVEVTFRFEADTLKCLISGMGIVIDVDGDYGMSKDGTIFGRITKVEKKGICAGPKVGDLFTFSCKVKDNTLTISKLGPGEDNDAKALIEGDYKKK